MAEEFDTFWGHVASLRRIFLSIGMIILIGTLCAFFFYQEVFQLLTLPLHPQELLQRQEIRHQRLYNPGKEVLRVQLPNSSRATSFSDGTQQIGRYTFILPSQGTLEVEIIAPASPLVVLGPLEGFVTSLKISFWVGLIGTSPLWLWLLLQFISPALRPRERQLVLPFFLLAFVALAVGFLFAFYITIPLANQYLQTFNESLGTNLWTLSSYTEYTATLLLANAAAFELFVAALFAVHLGFVDEQQLINKRRHFCVAAFIIGAILTPPDVLTQFMLAVPLVALYEVVILYARWKSPATSRYKLATDQ